MFVCFPYVLFYFFPHARTSDGSTQLHINVGLDKLRETQRGVEDMQRGLAAKERHLRYSSTAALPDFSSQVSNPSLSGLKNSFVYDMCTISLVPVVVSVCHVLVDVKAVFTVNFYHGLGQDMLYTTVLIDRCVGLGLRVVSVLVLVLVLQ